jgi:hypothetical protein
MPLTFAQKTAARNLFAPTPQPMVLFHGTTDMVFFSRICGRFGFDSAQTFMGYYSLRPLGGTSVYGPGIYLADKRAEARKYGHMIIRFEFEANTNYVDLTGGSGTNFGQNIGGVPRQNILDEPELYALIKVTPEYYVLRTPFNFIVGPDPNPSPVKPIWT